ncbi:MAG: PHP domain-containing protein, partial [Anaerolineales bacterium]
MYIHLTTHSAYSLLEGLPLPSELAQAAKASGMTALGLADHRTLTGAIEFVRACKQADIQPILGLDVDLATAGRLPLLAECLEGWSNLCRLSSV